ncbi:unnamed protein product [Heterobilharzia americana]|nr:unnamed protein product [Heterobilharzia americana]
MLNCCTCLTYVIIVLNLINYLFANTNMEYRWSQWSATPLTCSVTCGSGVRCRVRSCIDGYGTVQATTTRCQSTDIYHSQAKECIPCFVNVHCPRIPGWGIWGPWSSCVPIEGNQEVGRQGCRTGSKTRYRLCDSPPPEPPPHGLNCSGPNQQILQCSYDCVDRTDSTPDNIANKISFQNILRKHVSQKVLMDCATPAYNLAKRLSLRGINKTASRALKGRSFSIRWLKNGKPINLANPSSNVLSKELLKAKNIINYEKRIADEEIRWNLLLDTSSIYMEDTHLIFPSIQQGDQGFYTCQMKVGKNKWNIIFYTLIVTGTKYVALDGNPFYLHSNLGYSNSLNDMSVWMESAQIVWQLNGHEYSRGLAIRLNRRIQLISHLNLTHQGTWKCFLCIPAYSLPSQVGNPRSSISRIYLTNEFHLKINPTQNILWQISEYPPTVRTLRQTALTVSLIGLFLVLTIFLSIWAARRWTTRALTIDQQKAIIQEIVDNECRLLLTCKKRATINKNKLLPLILQESQRLQKTSKFLGVLRRRRTSRLGSRRVMRKATRKMSFPPKSRPSAHASKFIPFGCNSNSLKILPLSTPTTLTSPKKSHVKFEKNENV